MAIHTSVVIPIIALPSSAVDPLGPLLRVPAVADVDVVAFLRRFRKPQDANPCLLSFCYSKKLVEPREKRFMLHNPRKTHL